MKLYTNKKFTNTNSIKLAVFVILLLSSIFSSYSQVRVPFTPRTSTDTPSKTVYKIKGDFSMVGNTNLTLVNYGNNTANNNDMKYVDEDGTIIPGNNTLNSSSATLTFSTENGAIPDCSKIIYAGLYWTGRADTSADDNTDGDNDPNTFQVTKGTITKNFDKRKVSIKGPLSANYTEVTAGPSGIVANPINIAFPTNGDDRNMYSSYAEVTDYVKQNGIGEYFVADIALREGDPDGTGYYGGWGMVVVYENSKMDWRDITVFDGHAYVLSGVASHTIDVSGFNAVQNGNVNLKLGVMAGEGDVPWTGDYLEMIIPDGDDDENNLSTLNNNSYQPLSHSGNTTGNFFNSSIVTGGNARNPSLQNNTGLDIAMFDIDNTGNVLIPNNKTYTRFRYGSTLDTYIIFNLTFSVDAYVPVPEGVLNITSVNGNPPSTPDTLEPGQFSDYTLEIKNTGTEATDNTVITIPLPDSVNPNNLNITTNTYPPFSTTNIPVYTTGPGFGSNGSIVWNLGTLPVPPDPGTVLADISFRLTVTTDCSILTDPSFSPDVTLDGNITGVGAISNVPFDFPLIQGYETTGLCVGEPIPTPIIIAIEYLDFINQQPTPNVTYTQNNVLCNGESTGDINVTVSNGVPPYFFSWTGPNSYSATTEDITNLAAGTYDLLVTDSNNCGPVDAQLQVTITEPAVQTCDIHVFDCPPVIGTVCADTDLGSNVIWTPPSFAYECCTSITGDDYSFFMEFDLPESSFGSNCWDFNFAQRVGTDNLRLFQSSGTGNRYDDSYLITPKQFFDNSSGTPINIELIDVTATVNWTLFILDPDTDAVLYTFSVTGINSDGLQTINIPNTVPNGSYKLKFNFDSSNANGGDKIEIDRLYYNSTILDANCTGGINFVVTSTHNPGDLLDIGDTTVTYTATYTPASGDPIILNCGFDITVIGVDTSESTSEHIDPTCIGGSDGSITVTGSGGSAPYSYSLDDIDYTNTTGVFNGLAAGAYNVYAKDSNGCVDPSPIEITLVVVDTEDPKITAPLSMDIEGCDAGDVHDAATTIAELELLGFVISDDTTANGDLTVVSSSDSASGTNPIVITRTYTIADDCDNSSQAEQIINISDSTLPTLVGCPANIDLFTNDDGGADCEVTVNYTAPTFADNCDGTGTATYVSGPQDGDSLNASGSPYTVIYTYTDAAGNAVAANCEFTITVSDNTVPTLVGCPANIDLFTNDDGGADCEVTVNYTAPTFADNCDGTGTATYVSGPQDGDSLNASGSPYTVIYTYTDAAGNAVAANCEFTITVSDNTVPTLVGCPANIDLFTNDDGGADCEVTVNYTAPTFADNCDGTGTATYVSGPQDGDSLNASGSPYTVIYTYTDAAGNAVAANCEFTITVSDNTVPTLVGCPANIDLFTNDDGGADCEVTVNYTAPTFADNCDGTGTATYVSGPQDGDSLNASGSPYTVIYTYTDAAGNAVAANCEFTITVSDNTVPTLVGCPANIDLFTNDDGGADCEVTVNYTAPTFADNCDGTGTATYVSGPQDGDSLNASGSPYTVIYTYTDAAGNAVAANCEFTITVSDNTLPTFTCPGDLTAQCDISEQPEYTTYAEFLTASGSASDNCSINEASFTLLSEVSNNLTCPETVTRTYQIADASGNTATCTQQIVIDDETPPTIDGSIVESIVTGCDTTVVPDAETTVAGLEALGVSISDTCTDDASLTIVSSDDPSGTCPIIVTRTYTVTDACGNTSEVEHIINIHPAEITHDTPDDKIVDSCDFNSGDATADQIALDEDIEAWVAKEIQDSTDDFTGGCSPFMTSNFNGQSIDLCEGGIVTIIFTVNDPCQQHTHDATYTLTKPDTAPVLTAPIATSIEACSVADALADYSESIVDITGQEATYGFSVAEACNFTVTYQDATVGSCPWTVTRTFVATDACGNSDTETQTITIDDDTAPVLTAPIATSIEACSVADALADYSESIVDITGQEATYGFSVVEACSFTVTYQDATVGSCPWVVTRTFIATDACGNSDTETQTITIDDDTAPVLTAPIATSIEACSVADALADYSESIVDITGQEATYGFSVVEACNFTVTYQDATVGSCPWTVTRTFVATDACGNSDIETQTITIDDDTAPVLTAPIATSIEACSVADALADYSESIVDITGQEATYGFSVAEACSFTVTYQDATVGSCPWVVTRTFIATDACGNSDTETQTITIDDDTAPVLTAPIATSIEACSVADALADYSESIVDITGQEATYGFSVVEACNFTVTYQDATVGSCPWVVTRTFIATDACGNSDTETQTITIDDDTAPVLTAPIATSIEACSVADALADYSESIVDITGQEATYGFSVVEACNFTVTYQDATVGSCPWTVTRTFVATDACGNSDTETQTITIDDDTAPVLTAPIATSIEACSVADALADYSESIVDITGQEATYGFSVVEACSFTVTYQDATVGSCPWTVTRTFIATDACGNSDTETQTITIDDDIAPVLTAPIATSIEACSVADALADYSESIVDITGQEATYGFSVVEACSFTVTYQDATVGSCPWTVTRTFIATDACGNSDIETQTITIDDDTAPVLTAPIATSIEACSVADALADYSESIVDITGQEATYGFSVAEACNFTVTYQDATVGSCPWTVTRTFVATDACGNSDTETQTITIDDDTAPVLTAPIATSIEACSVADALADYSESIVDITGQEATYGFSVVEACNFTVTYQDATVGSCPWVVTRTFIATDACGNSDTETQTITIDDDTAPVLTAPIATSIEACSVADALADYSESIVDITGQEATYGFSVVEACNFTVTYQDATVGSCPWTVTRTFVATDACGNSDIETQTITIDDDTAPVLTAPIATSIEACSVADALADYSESIVDITGQEATYGFSVAEACSFTVTYQDATVGSCPWVVTRTFIATDACGNSDTETQTITIDDDTAPVLTAPIATSIEACSVADALADYSESIVDITGQEATYGFSVVEACSFTVTYQDATVGSCPWTVTRTFIATDACGNSDTETQTITIDDDTAPVLTAPIATSIEACSVADALADYSESIVDITGQEATYGFSVVEACNFTVTYQDATVGSCPWTVTRTFVATDACGNSDTETQTITIDDDTAPVLTAPIATSIEACSVADALADYSESIVDITGQEATYGFSVVEACSFTVTYQDATVGSCPWVVTRTFIATDACGNLSTTTASYLIKDTVAPTVDTAANSLDASLECSDASGIAAALALIPTATDDCSTPTLNLISDATSQDPDCPSAFIQIRTWNFTDACGNISPNFTQTIIIVDTTAPEPSTTFEEEISVSCTEIPDVPALEFTDNCTSNITVVFEETNTFDENVFVDYEIVRTWTVTDECDNTETYTQTLNVSLDEVITELTVGDRCYDDGIVDLNDFIGDLNTNGTWELLLGDPVATLSGNIFDPSTLELSEDFLPKDGGIDYLFRYTTTEDGCISITEVSMNINADCVVLPCGEDDVVISKAVTPNGDGFNETFDIAGIDLCGFTAEVKVFNRWGALVYESNNYQTGDSMGNWRGTSHKSAIGNSGTVPNGTYYYIIKLKNSGLDPFTGPVYLGTK